MMPRLTAVHLWHYRSFVDFTLELPNRRFNRSMGMYSDLHFDPKGNPISEETFEANRDKWLLSPADNEYLLSIMKPVREPGKFANWIAPPRRGLHTKT